MTLPPDLERDCLALADKVNNQPVTGTGTLTSRPGEFASEAEFQTAVIKLARMLGWRVAHFRKVRVQRKSGKTFWETPVAADGKGFPDLLCLRDDGRQVVLELKFGTNGATPEQRAWLGAFARAGVTAGVYYPKDWPELVAALTAAPPSAAASAPAAAAAGRSTRARPAGRAPSPPDAGPRPQRPSGGTGP